MKLIVLQSWLGDWEAYDDDGLSGICGDPDCGCRRQFIRGTADTPEEAIQEFVTGLLDKHNIQTPIVNKIVHGISCPKAPHTREGYLHAEDDDSPYDVDGCMYCGRCHWSLSAAEALETQKLFDEV